jgi:hypothetical protein
MRAIVVVDFEFGVAAGERPDPTCVCAKELYSGQAWRLMRENMPASPPWPAGKDVLFVSYYAPAELGCYLVLNWPMPERILDLYAEYRNLTNGHAVGRKLVNAMDMFDLDHLCIAEKKEMQEAIGNGTWREKFTEAQVLDYCWSDIDATERLLCAMWPHIEPELPYALVRGRYMSAVSRMEDAGIPIDVPLLDRLRARWDGMKDALIARIDAPYQLFEGQTFKYDRFEAWLSRMGYAWPRLESGQLDLSDDCFAEMARIYPAVGPIKELRVSLSSLRLNDLCVGRDGRNRTMLSPFGARSSRNTPSNAKLVFGPHVWIRGLIVPPAGYVVAYLDYSQQEFAIAAALSGDRAMMGAYRSGDPYLEFAKQAGAVPADATKKSHKAERELFKTCALGVQYGMGAWGLARRLDKAPIVGRDLIRAHRQTYRQFWAWSEAAVDQAMTRSKLFATFGWTIHIGTESNPRSLRTPVLYRLPCP